jgi:hypothetical protein
MTEPYKNWDIIIRRTQFAIVHYVANSDCSLRYSTRIATSKTTEILDVMCSMNAITCIRMMLRNLNYQKFSGFR